MFLWCGRLRRFACLQGCLLTLTCHLARNTCTTEQKSNDSITTGDQVDRVLIDHDNPKTMTESHMSKHMSECHMLLGFTSW
jgi:hypothetical protein